MTNSKFCINSHGLLHSNGKTKLIIYYSRHNKDSNMYSAVHFYTSSQFHNNTLNNSHQFLCFAVSINCGYAIQQHSHNVQLDTRSLIVIQIVLWYRTNCLLSVGWDLKGQVGTRGRAAYEASYIFCLFRNVHTDWSYDCTLNITNDFEEVKHCLAILWWAKQWPHLADCSCVQRKGVQPTRNMFSAARASGIVL